MATKRAATRRKPRKDQVETLVSLPGDVVLAPQAEAPRQPTGRDLSRGRPSALELSWADFDRHVQALAREVSGVARPEAVVGLAHGGVFVGGAMAGALGVDFFPVRLSQRSRDRAGRARVRGEMPEELQGRTVLLVDDVANSGSTLEVAALLARKAGARTVRTATLVCRPGGFCPDHHALSTTALVVFPWDYAPVLQDSRFDVDPDKAGA